VGRVRVRDGSSNLILYPYPTFDYRKKFKPIPDQFGYYPSRSEQIPTGTTYSCFLVMFSLNCVIKFLPNLCEFQALTLGRPLIMLKNLDSTSFGAKTKLSDNKFMGKETPSKIKAFYSKHTPVNCVNCTLPN